MSLYYYNSSAGILEIVTGKNSLLSIQFVKKSGVSDKKTGYLKEVISQLDEYFKGKRKRFDLKLEFEGTDFQKKVWEELIKVPFGKAISYKELAKKVKNPKGYRAVANALNKNHILLVIPCHRIISSDGSIGGFGAGIKAKRILLSNENIRI